MSDRPEVETLVHNLEHGYTVVWYRDGAPDDVVKTLQSIAKTFSSDDYDPADKFIVGALGRVRRRRLPGGQERRARPVDRRPGRSDRHHQAVRRPAGCVAVSGQAIADFMAKYPVANSPEPCGA